MPREIWPQGGHSVKARTRDFYCWGLVLARQVTGLISKEIEMEVVDFDSDFEVVDSAKDFLRRNIWI